LAMPTMSPFLDSNSFAFAVGIIDQASRRRANLKVEQDVERARGSFWRQLMSECSYRHFPNSARQDELGIGGCHHLGCGNSWTSLQQGCPTIAKGDHSQFSHHQIHRTCRCDWEGAFLDDL